MIGHVMERMTELDITKCRNSNPVFRPIIIVLEQIEVVDFEMFGVARRVLGGIDTQRRNGFESVIREKFVFYFEDLVEVGAVVICPIEVSVRSG